MIKENKLYEIARKNNMEIKHILLTHTHTDHVEAVDRVVAKTGATIYVHKNEFEAISHVKTKIIQLDNDTEFEVKEDATKSQIRSAFKKSLNGKKMNKKILGEFVELIA